MNWLWWVALGVLLVLTLLVGCRRRPVKIRLVSFGWWALIFVALRCLSAVVGDPVEAPEEWWGLTATLAAGGILCLCQRVWVVSASRETLCDQVQWGCQILFLHYTKSTTRTFLLTHKDVTQRLRLVALSRRWQVVILPKRRDSAKMALLVDWLSKQYSGPLPRFRIVLNKE
jgi:hypothetical protein